MPGTREAERGQFCSTKPSSELDTEGVLDICVSEQIV
jgi:hypothetical protein